MPKTPPVTIAELSRNKMLPADVLRSYGLSECEDGVLFTYRLATGEPGRTRLRSALRGSDGSDWRESDAYPITAYTAPSHVAFCEPRTLLIVEGESDCWTAWMHGFRAIGLPGSDRVKVLTREHLESIDSVFIQRENMNGTNKTYPNGVDHFVATVALQLKNIGYQGAVLVLRMPENFADMSDLYLDAPSAFKVRLTEALNRSTRYGL